MIEKRIRAPAAAGRFYPADPAQLRALVEKLLDGAAGKESREWNSAETACPNLKGLIVPHAGYMYSGPIAASGYALLRRSALQVHRVILVGPAHFIRVAGIAASKVSAFDTPLGSVPLDAAGIEVALGQPGVVLGEEAHAPDHALEVHLPFLQVLLGEFSIVPLLVGRDSFEGIRQVLDALWGGPETLIVVSSDLSHYHDWATASRLDAETARAIEALRPESIPEDGACGRLAIGGLLAAARDRGLSARTVDLRNSGDTAGSPDKVVGYGAFAVGGPEK